MGLYDRIADRSVSVRAIERSTQSADTTSDFVRTTTTIALSGAGETGRGEDVTYDAADHEALAEAPADAFDDLRGEYTIEEFAAALDDVELFPTGAPERSASRKYRRWAFESAALDLALRQAGESLGDALGREYDPVRFVVSTRLGSPPTAARIKKLRERVSDLDFKLDPTTEWDEALVEELAIMDVVRILDLKGWYEGTEVDQDPDPGLYRLVLEGFPDAIVEDPAFDPATEGILEDHRDRLSFDAPISSVEDVKALPVEPRWLNVKPSRFGSLEALFEAIDYCRERGIRMYGGGQFELDVGREQIQALASLCYPDGPNDVAPREYNLPESAGDLPASPLEPAADPSGFAFEPQ